MSPYQHGEVFVTSDGAETDLDLGHYERFTTLTLTKYNSLTTGQVYDQVISKERMGKYSGGTVQVIPHVTNEIKKRIHKVSEGYDVTIVEIGGTVGDIEGLPYIEAIRQLRNDMGSQNTAFIHVTYVPFYPPTQELKSKPTQHSVKELREVGVQPDFLVCRSDKPIPKSLTRKISLFCNVQEDHIISAETAPTIYDIPLVFKGQKFDEKLYRHLEIKKTNKKPYTDWNAWKKIVHRVKNPKARISIGIVGKYTSLKDSYKSLSEAIHHGGIASQTEVNIHYINSEKLGKKIKKDVFKGLDGILVPGGFGVRAIEGKVQTVRYAREKKIPFLGICLGMQVCVLEFARNVCSLKGANSREFAPSPRKKSSYVIDFLPSQRDIKAKGGTMRLGSYPCHVVKGTLAHKIYKKPLIKERHRHRYEVNSDFQKKLASHGMVFSGFYKKENVAEMVEIPSHPWFLGVQFHPEFESRPLDPHPIFVSFVKSCIQNKKGGKSR